MIANLNYVNKFVLGRFKSNLVSCALHKAVFVCAVLVSSPLCNEKVHKDGIVTTEDLLVISSADKWRGPTVRRLTNHSSRFGNKFSNILYEHFIFTNYFV